MWCRLQAAAKSAAASRKRFILPCLLLLAGSWFGATSAVAQSNRLSPAEARAAADAFKPHPEALLLEVYKELGANRLRQAQLKADELVAAYPNFQLGQLIRGDLLQLHTRPISSFGAVSNAPQDKLKNLRDEAVVRMKRLQQKPDPNLVPRMVLKLRDDQRFALVVDARRSRLYVYENQRGQLKLTADYYVSQGKYGINKLREGDQKTPIGVYYITQRVPGAKLPDFYGSGALPINYPNEWDKINGRSGSGIWLHGTPSDSYSRPPLSSDGCVVLTNPDFYKLYHTVEAGKTPVVITDRVEFVSKAKWESERNMARKLLETWRRDIESGDLSRLKAHYSQQFKPERGESLQTLLEKHARAFSGMKNIAVQLKDVSLFLYPGREDLIVSTFTQESVVGKGRNTVRKRQYWARQGGQWKILMEANL